MENQQLDSIIERLASYNLFSYFFLALPDEKFVNKIMGLEFGKVADDGNLKGVKLIQQYISGCRVKTLASVLQELAIDRTQLLRGLTEDGPRPPYESLYLKLPPTDVMGSLNTIYAQADFAVSKDIRESSEQIGIELSFMKELCDKELVALKDGACREIIDGLRQVQHDFLNQHLGRWAGLFAEEMAKFAKTDFYRGVAFLLKEFITEEMASSRKIVLS